MLMLLLKQCCACAVRVLCIEVDSLPLIVLVPLRTLSLGFSPETMYNFSIPLGQIIPYFCLTYKSKRRYFKLMQITMHFVSGINPWVGVAGDDGHECSRHNSEEDVSNAHGAPGFLGEGGIAAGVYDAVVVFYWCLHTRAPRHTPTHPTRPPPPYVYTWTFHSHTPTYIQIYIRMCTRVHTVHRCDRIHIFVWVWYVFDEVIGVLVFALVHLRGCVVAVCMMCVCVCLWLCICAGVFMFCA